MHGIVWGIGTDQLIKEKWNYGITFTGNYVNEKTINYITKYMTKIDEKHPGKSIKHWFTTELGHEKTERLHLHGIVWGIGTDQLVEEKWNYGITYTGNYVNEKTEKKDKMDDTKQGI